MRSQIDAVTNDTTSYNDASNLIPIRPHQSAAMHKTSPRPGPAAGAPQQHHIAKTYSESPRRVSQIRLDPITGRPQRPVRSPSGLVNTRVVNPTDHVSLPNECLQMAYLQTGMPTGLHKHGSCRRLPRESVQIARSHADDETLSETRIDLQP